RFPSGCADRAIRRWAAPRAGRPRAGSTKTRATTCSRNGDFPSGVLSRSPLRSILGYRDQLLMVGRSAARAICTMGTTSRGNASQCADRRAPRTESIGLLSIRLSKITADLNLGLDARETAPSPAVGAPHMAQACAGLRNREGSPLTAGPPAV